MTALLLAAVLATAAAAPEASQAPDGRLAVFLDCSACDESYVRTEITFVSYVRDRETADIHVLVTGQQTASAGRAFALAFIGLGPRAGQDQTLGVVTQATDSEDDVRRALVQTLRLGLLRYVADTPLAPAVLVTFQGLPPAAAAAPVDRWNHWVFALRGEAALEREESSGEFQFESSISADRITENWKLTTGVELFYSAEQFTVDEGDIESLRQERRLQALIVKSLGRHWSVGGRSEVESSTFENTAIGVRLAPAVEFNVFPYDESTRRELRILYSLGPRYARYREATVFGRLREMRIAHELAATLDRQEAWGTTEARIEWSQYLDDLSKNRLEASFEISLRLRRGLSLSVDLEASRIRDQLALPARGATPEEILLRQRQLASGYEIELAFGLTYRFGSIFSSIVNPRFGN